MTPEPDSASSAAGGTTSQPDRPLGAASGPVRVAVLNDYEIVVAGTAHLLAPFGSRVVLVDAGVGGPAPYGVDVVLYDAFAQRDGATPHVADVVPHGSPARLVVYTWRVSPDLVERARAAGAAGLVTKADSAADIVAVIEAVHRGGSVFPDGRADDPDPAPGTAAGWRWPGEEHGLSARESEVLAYICRGLGNQEVAARMFLGVNTVKTYIRTTYRKIGVVTRAQAVIWALSHGFGGEGAEGDAAAPTPLSDQ